MEIIMIYLILNEGLLFSLPVNCNIQVKRAQKEANFSQNVFKNPFKRKIRDLRTDMEIEGGWVSG